LWNNLVSKSERFVESVICLNDAKGAKKAANFGSPAIPAVADTGCHWDSRVHGESSRKSTPHSHHFSLCLEADITLPVALRPVDKVRRDRREKYVVLRMGDARQAKEPGSLENAKNRTMDRISGHRALGPNGLALWDHYLRCPRTKGSRCEHLESAMRRGEHLQGRCAICS
jgi:hypothetical protein